MSIHFSTMARFLFSTTYVALGCASHLVSGDCWLLLLLLVIRPVYNSYGGVVEDCWKSPSTTGIHPQVDGAATPRPVFQLFLLVRPSENQHRTPTTGLEGEKQTTVIENSHRLFQGAKINSSLPHQTHIFLPVSLSKPRCPQRVESINGGLSLGGAT